LVTSSNISAKTIRFCSATCTSPPTFGFRVSGFGFRVSGFGSRASESGFRVLVLERQLAPRHQLRAFPLSASEARFRGLAASRSKSRHQNPDHPKSETQNLEPISWLGRLEFRVPVFWFRISDVGMLVSGVWFPAHLLVCDELKHSEASTLHIKGPVPECDRLSPSLLPQTGGPVHRVAGCELRVSSLKV
jgi:hypothetical protein